jgi:Ca2+-binding RTX toxin-like protein
MTGGAGDDVMDGDAWLNTRIQATSNSGVVTSHTSMATLSPGLLNGTINPGNLVIVREILKAATPGAADVAVFSGARANYTIAALSDGIRVVTDNVGANGVDLLRNFEIIRFANQDVAILPNRSATGAPLISDTTPTEGGALTVNTAAIADADGLGAFSFQWQTSTNSGATWANIAGATTAAFTPVQQQVNTQLRVAVRFTDGQGFAEEVFATATDVVGDLIVTGAGNDTINGTAGADNINAGAGNDSINGLAGNDTLLGGAGADTINGGTGADSMVGGAGNDTYTVDDAGDILVEAANGGTDTVSSSLASFTLANNFENLVYTGTGTTAATGNGAANVITGALGNDTLNGAAGNDTLNGGAGNDSLIGDIGFDRMFGGNGDDVLSGGGDDDVLTGGNGADTLTGGASGDRFDFDTLAEITGDVITDFETSTDVIDLSTIDANAVTAGNGTFASGLLTTNTIFTAAAQLRVYQDGLNTLVEGNTDNIFTSAEFRLVLTGVSATNVLSTNFIR